MLEDDSMKLLSAMSAPRNYARGQYICYEGEPGTEMFIITKGNVSVCVSDASEQLREITRLKPGEIFGEMAILDDLPRSASCIALDDVTCIAVDKEGLPDVILACPDVAMLLLENLSGRLRKMNIEIYKGRSADPSDRELFMFPGEYMYSHGVDEPQRDERYVQDIDFSCPVCRRNITVPNLRKYVMTPEPPDSTGRIRFRECNHLWYEIWNCPHCNYSNYYRRFFNIADAARDSIAGILKKNNEAENAYMHLIKTPFDRLVLSYLRSIHLNSIFARNDHALNGKLWLDLYYLLSDAEDPDMAAYCGRNAAEMLVKAVRGGEIENDRSMRLLALAAADLMSRYGSRDITEEMCDICIAGRYEDICGYAVQIKEHTDSPDL